MDAFRQVVIDIMTGSDVVAYSQLDDHRKRVDALIETASRIGGDIDKERAQLLDLLETIAAAAENAFSILPPAECADSATRYREGSRITKAKLGMLSGLIGQITRPDFPQDQLIPTVLTEDAQTISRILDLTGDGAARRDFRVAAEQVLEEAVKEGFSESEAAQKRKALGLVSGFLSPGC